MYWQDKVVLITGASSGIGRALAVTLARQGAVVVAVARREPLLLSLLEEIQPLSPTSSYIAGDISEEGFAEEIIRYCITSYGQLDVLVNNAAMPMHTALSQLDSSRLRQVMDTNFMACACSTLAALPHLERTAGMVVNISSFATQVVPTHETAYVASKSALDGFSRGLAVDLAASDVHVLLVHPGPIDTEIWDKLQQQGAYAGKRYPADRTAAEILRAMSRREYEVTVPRWSLRLLMGRLVNALAPALVRASVQRMDPVEPLTPK